MDEDQRERFLKTFADILDELQNLRSIVNIGCNTIVDTMFTLLDKLPGDKTEDND